MNLEELSNGIELFNQGKFFDAHEVLEDVWRTAPAAQKQFFQGLVQVAVAFHHYSAGNRVGMKSVLERAMRNLSAGKESFSGIRLQPLLETLAAWREAQEQDCATAALPRVELVESD